MSDDNSKSIFGIPIRTDLQVLGLDNFKPKEIDQIRNYFTSDAEGIELFSILRSDTWEFRSAGTPYFFKIQGDDILSNVKFYNDITLEKFSVEELLSSKKCPELC